ncbi:hypothetical protein [Kineosporia babensis]|uniref:Uncharacterized protein n=1 Tax=Kineosporia babensis TaxID=499548 RepID=A0A9X1N942_9ACTN|nr:hypothetical protein [Kineosporia babensis]MCD5310672.1 hypothetical protein [Kineosporia babensis]
MSSEEKRTWVSAVAGLAVSAGYLVFILSRVPGTDVAQIGYVGPMLGAIGIGIVTAIVLSIIASVVRPQDPALKDERDREINRRGEYAGFYVMSIATLVPLALTMAEAEHFWIAHTLYLAFVLASLASAAVKITAYRRGW